MSTFSRILSILTQFNNNYHDGFLVRTGGLERLSFEHLLGWIGKLSNFIVEV